MATYTNLESLSGLQVGDVVNYTLTNVTVDFAGQNVHVILYGTNESNTYSGQTLYSYGGKTEFDLNSSLISTPTFIVTNGYGRSLCYGSNDLNHRIAVAGNPGGNQKKTGAQGGNGGGLTGGNGSGSSTNGTGGSQTAGGVGGSNGSFGPGGQKNYTCWGGWGWYGGGSGGNSYYGGGGGGSGFVIGHSTTVYPSGYMGNDSTLIAELSSIISNATLTQGGAIENTNSYKAVLTIIAPASTTHETVKVYDSTQQSFVPCEVYYYTNGDFQLCEVYEYDGTDFIKIEV